MNSIKKALLRTLDAGARLLNLVLVGYMGLFFVCFGLTYLKEAPNYPILKRVGEINQLVEGPAVAFLRGNLPTKFDGVELAPWMFILAVFTLVVMVSVYRERLFHHAAAIAHTERLADRNRKLAEERLLKERAVKEAAERADRAARERQEAEAKARTEREALYRKQLEDIAKAQREALERAEQKSMREQADESASRGGHSVPRFKEGASRDELLELMAKAKKSLDQQKRSVAFLSIDIINSTGMKQGEDQAIAERDFRQYKRLAEAAIDKNGALKAAWTPDGVMICFSTTDGAVAAAKEIIRNLGHFNKHVKAMRSDFAVRCGVNAGVVLFDEAVPMEEMSDRTIDVAGHMQKYAKANTIYIGKHAIAGLREPGGFSPAGQQVDGYEVYQWTPNADIGANTKPSAA